MWRSATGVHLTDDNLKSNRVFPFKSKPGLTHGQQPLRADLRGEVGEALGQVCGGRSLALAHIEVVGIIWNHKHADRINITSLLAACL